MKRFLLIACLLCPALKAESDIVRTWEKINSYRVTSGVKCVLQVILGGYAFKHAAKSAKAFTTDVNDALDSGKRSKALFWKSLDDGVVTGGMGYTSCVLFCKAWKNAKHALAIK